MLGTDLTDQVRHRFTRLHPRVERAFAMLDIDALAGDAVSFGAVPKHQRLPHMVVREVRVLIVRRV